VSVPNPVLRLLIAAVLLCSSLPARAQHDPEIAARRALIEREQQSETFSLQLRQSQQKLNLSADSAGRVALDALHLEQLHRQELLGQDELRQLTPLSGYDRARRENARNAQSLQFGREAPAWGPSLEAPSRWTPSLERPAHPWTPTLE
jgi:hypothetical protein